MNPDLPPELGIQASPVTTKIPLKRPKLSLGLVIGIIVVLIILAGVAFAGVQLFGAKSGGNAKATPTPAVLPGVSKTEQAALKDAITGGPTVLQVTQVITTNANIDTLLAKALQVTGEVSVGANLTVSGNGGFGGTVTAANFVGSGANLTGLNADLLNGQPGSYYATVGGLQSQVSGALSSANVALRNSPNTFSANNSFAGALNVSGPASLTGTTTISSLVLGAPLAVGSGGTGLASIPVSGVVYGQGAANVGVAVPSAAGQCLVSTATDVQFGSCSAAASGVATLNGLNGALTLANASAAGATVTIDNASAAAKGIASFNATNFSVTAGAVNTVQDLAVASTPTFGGVSLTNAFSLAIGTSGPAGTTGSVRFYDGGSAFFGTLRTSPLTGTRTVSLPDETGTVCLQNSANCGFSLSGSGVASVNGQTGALTVANASAAAGLITINDATAAAKGIASFNATNLTVTAGSVNTIQDIAVGSTPTFASLNLTAALTVANGGTGAATAAAARTNLGVAASGSNADITALTGLTTAITSAQGGTGVVTTPTNGQILIGNGSGYSLNTLTAGSGITITPAAGSITITAGGAGTCATCADADLSNLSGVAINTSLLPAIAGGASLGSAVLPFGQLALAGSSASPATNNFLITGASTSGTRTITLPDASGTIAVSASGPLALDALGNVTCATCLTSGGGGGTAGVSDLNTATGALTLQGASAGSVTTTGNAITIVDATAAVKGLASFSTNFSVTAGAVDTIQGIATTSTPTFAGLSLTAALSVANGGTGANTLATDGVIIGHGTSALTSLTGSNGECLLIVGTTPTFGTCPGSAGSVASLNGQTGVVDIANASGAGGIVTIDDATAAAKGIASFNATNFLVSGGAVNTIQDISVTSNPTFGFTSVGRLNASTSAAASALIFGNNTNASATGNLLEVQLNGASRLSVAPNGNTAIAGVLSVNTITPTGALTIGSTTQAITIQGNSSSVITATSGANSTTLAFQTPTSTRTITLPDATGTVCLSSGNCVGATGVTLQGTTPGTPDTGNFNISGVGITGTSLQSPLLKTANQTAASTNSADLSISTGNASGTTSNSGKINIDVGTATSSKGAITIGGTNSQRINIGTDGLGGGPNTSIYLGSTNAASISALASSFGLTTGAVNFNVTSSGYNLNGAAGTDFVLAGGSGASLLQADLGSNILTLGTPTLGGTTLSFANGSNANTVNIQGGTTSASYTTVLPAAIGSTGQCLSVGSVVSTTQTLGYATCSGGGGGVTLQGSTPGTADTGNLNVSGTAIAGTKVLTPAIDVASAGTLSVGTTTATTITLGGTTTATINAGTSANNKTINIGAQGTTNNTTAVNIGATSSTGGASAVQIGGTGATGGSNTVTTVTAQAGQTALSITNTGATLRTFTDSTTAFQLQNSAGTPLLKADTTNGRLSVGSAGTATGQLYVAGSVPSATAGSVATGTGPSSVYVQGRYSYVTNQTSNTLTIYDVSNPASPSSVGSVATGTNPFSIFVAGRYAYVANLGSNTLYIYDVSNPASPVNVGSVATGITPYSVFVAGRYAYVANYLSSTLGIYDVSNPASPVSVGSVATGTNARSVFVSGRYAYVANYGSNTMGIYDVSNPASPSSVGSVATGSGPKSVFVSGRYAYVANYTASTMGVYDMGGAYVQQLEAGGVEAGTVSVTNSLAVGGAASFGSGINVSGSASINGGLSSSGDVLFQTQANSTTAFQVQNTAGNNLLNVDTSGNVITIGKAGTGGINGKLALATTNASGFTSTLTVSASQSAQIDYTLPTAIATTGDCLKAGTVAAPSVPLVFGSCGGGGGVTLQGSTPGTADTGNLNISGTGIVGTKVLTPAIDVASAGTLSVGTTTATTITLGGPTTATTNIGTSANNKTINIGANGTTNNTTAINLGATTSTGGASTIKIGGTGANNGSNTSSTVAIQGGQSNLSITNAGVNVQTFSTSATAFQVQTSAGNAVLNVDTAGSTVTFGTASTLGVQLAFPNASNANVAYLKSGVTTANYTTLLPTAVGSTGQCLSLASVLGATQNLGYATCGGGITLQGTTPGTPDTGNFNISGTGIAATLQAGTVDTASAGTLSVGTTNATTITLGGTTTATTNIGTSANNKTINIGSQGITNNTTAINLGATTNAGGVNTIKIGGTGVSNGSAPGTTVAIQGGQTALNVSTGGVVINTFTNGGGLTIQRAARGYALQVNTSPNAAPNYLTNGDFEPNITGWALSGSATISQNPSSLNSYEGQYSLLVTTSASGAGASTNSFGTLAGPGTYTFSFNAKAGTNTGTVGVTFTGGGAPACNLTNTAMTTLGFRQFSCTFTSAGSNITAATITTTGGSNGTFYIDGVQFLLGSNSRSYYASHSADIQLRGDIVSPVVIQNYVDSQSVFQIQNAVGTSNTLVADTLNNQVRLATDVLFSSGGLSFTGASGASINGPSNQGLTVTTTGTGNLTLGANGNTLNLNNAATYNIGISDTTQAFHIGDGGSTNSQTITIGSTNSTSSTTIQGGTGTAVSLQTGASGTISVGTNNSASTINIGATTLSAGTQNILVGGNASTGTQNIIVGSGLSSSAGTTTIQGKDLVTLQSFGGGITIDTATAGQTTAIANQAITHTVNIASGAAIQTVTLGSTNSTSKTTIQGGVITTTNNQAGVIVAGGFSASDTNLTALVLDSSATLDEPGATCGSGLNGGALYFNSNPGSMALRSCIAGGGWQDVVTSEQLSLVLFGIVDESGTYTGDLASNTANGAGPCKVVMGSTNTTVTWTACTAYSSGRKVTVAAGTNQAVTLTSGWTHLCLSGTNHQPTSTNGASEVSGLLTASFPASYAPVACLADIAVNGSAITAIYDTRTFTSTTKQYATINSNAPLGTMVVATATSGVSVSTAAATANQGKIQGVIVAGVGIATTGTPGAIIATAGPAWVKATGGTSGDYVQTSTAGSAGYAYTSATASTGVYGTIGLARTPFTNTCTTGGTNNCSLSLLTILNIK